jgi:hypothetical protein
MLEIERYASDHVVFLMLAIVGVTPNRALELCMKQVTNKTNFNTCNDKWNCLIRAMYQDKG